MDLDICSIVLRRLRDFAVGGCQNTRHNLVILDSALPVQ